MTLDEEIKYWRQCADDAPTKNAALLAMGISMGLRIARNDHSIEPQSAKETPTK